MLIKKLPTWQINMVLVLKDLLPSCKHYMRNKARVMAMIATGSLMQPVIYRISSLTLLIVPVTVTNKPKLLNPHLRIWANRDT